MGRPNTALVISESEKSQLQSLVRSRSMPHSLVRRAKIVLLSADGGSNRAVATQCGVSAPVVSLWRSRYQRDGLAGLHSELRPGRPRKHGDDKVAGLLRTVLRSKPEVVTHWTVRSAAAKTGMSKSTVGRYFALFGVQPHRAKSFKLSTDPFFVEKVRDVVGLYLNPPDKALVLCVDEKSQIQALDRTQPLLPLRPGVPARQTHDYKRNGTTNLFAALNMLDGTVIGDCMPRHRHQEFIRFLQLISVKTPLDLNLHLIVDNYGTHKHPRVQSWLKRHPRFHLHFIPTSSSWLNMVERWFREITDRRIRRGSFQNVPDLIAAINQYIQTHNQNPKVFVWSASVERIMGKIAKCKEALETLH